MSDSSRPAGEVVVIWLTITVCTVLVLFVVEVAVALIWFPHLDLSAAARTVAGIINTVVGAIVGWLAGRNSKQD